jgi:hypothetical protein
MIESPRMGETRRYLQLAQLPNFSSSFCAHNIPLFSPWACFHAHFPPPLFSSVFPIFRKRDRFEPLTEISAIFELGDNIKTREEEVRNFL